MMAWLQSIAANILLGIVGIIVDKIEASKSIEYQTKCEAYRQRLNSVKEAKDIEIKMLDKMKEIDTAFSYINSTEDIIKKWNGGNK